MHPARLLSKRQDSRSGFTLVELVLALMILGILTGLGISQYHKGIEQARVAAAIGDITAISFAISEHKARYRELPASLDEVGYGDRLDPWGEPYVYLRLGGPGSTGQARKDRSLVPINSDYDLYSKGADGETVASLTASTSHDDVIRANNGGYVGLASGY